MLLLLGADVKTCLDVVSLLYFILIVVGNSGLTSTGLFGIPILLGLTCKRKNSRH